jgi:hypothetical protein
MKKLAIILFVLCFAAPAVAELKFNHHTEQYEYAHEGDELKYNPYSEQYEYAPPDFPKKSRSYQPPPEERPKETTRYSTEIPCVGCKPGEPSAIRYVHPQPIYTHTEE